jgi:hypothetical protein
MTAPIVVEVVIATRAIWATEVSSDVGAEDNAAVDLATAAPISFGGTGNDRKVNVETRDGFGNKGGDLSRRQSTAGPFLLARQNHDDV